MRRALARAAPLTLLFGMIGCGLFDTREPEPPVGQIPRLNPNHPDSVIFNLEQGVRFKHAGTPNIQEALAGSFVFVLDPPDAIVLGGIDSLDKAESERGFIGFYSRVVLTDSVLIDFKEPEEITIERDLGQIYEATPYEVIVFTNGRGEPPERRRIKLRLTGTIDLYFKPSGGGNFNVVRWVDRRVPDSQGTLGSFLGFYGRPL